MTIAQAAPKTSRLDSQSRLGLLCVCYVTAAIAIGPRDYLSFLVQYSEMMARVLPAIVLLAAALIALIESPQSPFSGMKRAIMITVVPATCVILGFLFFISAFTAFKFKIPSIVPFYADPYLADFGEFLHGDAPWRILHQWAPSWTPMVIDPLYSKVWFIQWFGVLCFVAFWNQPQQRLRYLWAFVLTMMIAGTFMATAFSSVGPIFYDQLFPGNRYGDLVTILSANPHSATNLSYASYLFDTMHMGHASAGTGISAMPSMHVAIAVLNAWFLTTLNRWLGIAGWLFAAAIMFGSVYTGWHYAVDGYVSIGVVSLIWWASARLAAAHPSRPLASARDF